MWKYIVKRLLQVIPILLAVSVIVFLILSYSPGDPAKLILGMNATEEQLVQLRSQLGLDKPVPIQYLNYMKNLLKGDFGTSYTTKLKVLDMIKVRLPITMTLAFGGLILIYIIGIPLGILLAVKQNSIFDNVARVLSLIMAAMPEFWLGLLLMLLFSVKLHLLPPNGFETPLHWIMPMLCYAVAGWATRSRLARACLLDVIRQDYIRTAKAKGLSERTVIYKHALKNALLPLVTSLGMEIGLCFGGAVVIEELFGINGIGKMLLAALRQKDIPTIMAGVLITAALIALSNLMVDLIYAFIDPRIRSVYIKSNKRTKKITEKGVVVNGA